MAKLDAGKRKGLRDSAFAYVDPQGRRRLPINDESHVRNALSRFNQVIFEDETARDRARTRLLNAAKRYGIVPVGFVTGQLRAHGRRELPTGALTFLMTDIEGSTALLLKLEERFSRLLADTRRIYRAVLRQAGGWEVDARADEFFAVFRRPAPAVGAAVAIQRSLQERAWADDAKVGVRIGIHSGRTTLAETGYVGIAVHTTSRVCSAGNGGQILLSTAARDAMSVARNQMEGVTFRTLGRYALAGLAEPEAVFQVDADGLRAKFPKLRVAAIRGNAG
jgi:class 3 adenylate cyclase